MDKGYLGFSIWSSVRQIGSSRAGEGSRGLGELPSWASFQPWSGLFPPPFSAQWKLRTSKLCLEILDLTVVFLSSGTLLCFFLVLGIIALQRS